MAALKMYTYMPNPRAYKGLIAAQYNGVEVDVPEFTMGETNKTDAFLKLNPMGKVPTLETPSGGIFESNAIARYIARMRRDTELYGVSFFESGLVDSWIDFSLHELETPLLHWLLPILGYTQYNAAVEKKAKAAVHKSLKLLDDHLLLRTFVVGERISLADIIMWCGLMSGFHMLLDAEARAAYPNVMRWWTTLAEQPQFKAVTGDVELCVVPREVEKKKGGKKKNKGGKKKGGDAADAAAAPAPKPAKKPKHPCATLPKSSMSLDAWKKTYSNSHDLRGDAMPKFWEMLDTEGYSLWLCNYNYNAENTKLFMTCNLVGGFIQRCDAFRKYAFGVMDILGSEGDSLEVCGAWLLRGQDHSFVLADNPDAEYYTWTKVDLADEAAKEKVAAFWCEEEEIDGKPIADSKVFK